MSTCIAYRICFGILYEPWLPEPVPPATQVSPPGLVERSALVTPGPTHSTQSIQRYSKTETRAMKGRCQRIRGKTAELVVKWFCWCHGSSRPRREMASAQLDLDGMYSHHIQQRRAYKMVCTIWAMRSRSSDSDRPLIKVIKAAMLSTIQTPRRLRKEAARVTSA